VAGGAHGDFFGIGMGMQSLSSNIQKKPGIRIRMLKMMLKRM
jgi:hypothetical protein